ncbi:RDD family protein [Gordonia sp. CPCC 205333]|uniref:RDD family protein n=1 Tax=Gordonia sp. CPCC 205333 TaxID=3140790 RepID=UPI003AF3EC75
MTDEPAEHQEALERNDIRHGVVHDTDRAAGIVSRGAAAGIDVAIVATLMGACYLGLLLVRLAINFTPHWSWVSAILTTTGFLALSVVYLFACWAISGRTAGSAIMGLRVVGVRGQHLRPTQALLRSLICVGFAVGLGWCAVDSRRRSVADILARTRVVYSR